MAEYARVCTQTDLPQRGHVLQLSVGARALCVANFAKPVGGGLEGRQAEPDDAELTTTLQCLGQQQTGGREIACLMYYPPMGMNSPYARFDDIWCGLVMQRVCRHLRLPIVCGHPLVEHRRASDPFANLEKEGPGVGANERMWELVDAIELNEETPLACMREMGTGLERSADGDEYVGLWGRAILEWCELFGQAS